MTSIEFLNDVIQPKTLPETKYLKRWVKVNKSSTKFFKPRMIFSTKYPQLKEDTFVLIVLTPAQRGLMKRHFENVVCIDKQKNYSYEVLNIMVMDDLGHSFPCASVFTDKIDSSVVQVYFTELHSVVGHATVKLLMTGVDPFIFDTWSQLIGQPESIICCPWEVLKQWRIQARDMIQNKSTRSAVLSRLKTLLNESNQKIVTQNLNMLIFELSSDVETQSYADYLFENYVENIGYWAPNEESYNIACQMENMHEGFKHILLDKISARIDIALDCVLDLFKNKIIERNGRVRELSNYKIEWVNFDVNHDLAKKCSFKVVKKESYWTVLTMNYKEDKRKIRYRNKDCKCEHKCKTCNVCPHVYVCSCFDSNVKLRMCRHIHGLCIHLATGEIENSTSDSDESEVENEYTSCSLENSLNMVEDESLCNNMSSVDPSLNHEVVHSDITEIKDEIVHEDEIHLGNGDTKHSIYGDKFNMDNEDGGSWRLDKSLNTIQENERESQNHSFVVPSIFPKEIHNDKIKVKDEIVQDEIEIIDTPQAHRQIINTPHDQRLTIDTPQDQRQITNTSQVHRKNIAKPRVHRKIIAIPQAVHRKIMARHPNQREIIVTTQDQRQAIKLYPVNLDSDKVLQQWSGVPSLNSFTSQTIPLLNTVTSQTIPLLNTVTSQTIPLLNTVTSQTIPLLNTFTSQTILPPNSFTSQTIIPLNSFTGQSILSDLPNTNQSFSEPFNIESVKVNLEHKFKTLLNSASNRSQLEDIEKTLCVLQKKILKVKSSQRPRKRQLTANGVQIDPHGLPMMSCPQPKNAKN